MVDASIYSLQKPLPPPINPMEVAGQAMQLRNQQQAGQINAERLKQEQQQTALADQDAADLRVVREHQAQFGGDMDKAIPALAGKINPTLYGKLQSGALAMKKQIGELRGQEREELKFRAGHIGAAGGLMLKTPPEQKQTAWQNERARLKAYGIELPEQYPGDDAMQGEVLDAMGLEKWLSEQRAEAGEQRAVAGEQRASAAAQREAELQPFKVQQAQGQAQLTSMEVAGEKPIQPAERARVEREDAAAKETARHNRAMEQRVSQATAAGLTQAQSQRVLQIAGQFDNEPMVKNFNTIAEAKNFVDTLGEGKSGNAGDDQAMLYAFAKAMDPGSVVREGEYATVQKYSQSWAQTFGFKAERIFSNSPFLSDDARQKMKATVAKKAASAKQSYDNIYNEYGRRIERQAGVQGGKDFLTNYGQAFQQPAQQPAPGGAKPPEITNQAAYDALPKGAQYTHNGEVLTKK
jgi:hypothetical protein